LQASQAELVCNNLLLLVDVWDVALFCLLHNHLQRAPDWHEHDVLLSVASVTKSTMLKILTGILSGYLSRMRAASAWRFSARANMNDPGTGIAQISITLQF
jgi:hypothetical protein